MQFNYLLELVILIFQCSSFFKILNVPCGFRFSRYDFTEIYICSQYIYKLLKLPSVKDKKKLLYHYFLLNL